MRCLLLVVVLLSGAPAFAQTPPGHAWIDLNVVRFDSLQGSQTSTHVEPGGQAMLHWSGTHIAWHCGSQVPPGVGESHG